MHMGHGEIWNALIVPESGIWSVRNQPEEKANNLLLDQDDSWPPSFPYQLCHPLEWDFHVCQSMQKMSWFHPIPWPYNQEMSYCHPIPGPASWVFAPTVICTRTCSGPLQGYKNNLLDSMFWVWRVAGNTTWLDDRDSTYLPYADG